LAYIAIIAGYFSPILQPLKPHIGLNSWRDAIICLSSLVETPVSWATSTISYSYVGKNSWSGGSSNLIITGLPFTDSKISTKSWV